MPASGWGKFVYRRIAPSWTASLDAGGLHSENPWELLDVPHILRKLKMRRYEASHFELYLDLHLDLPALLIGGENLGAI